VDKVNVGGEDKSAGSIADGDVHGAVADDRAKVGVREVFGLNGVQRFQCVDESREGNWREEKEDRQSSTPPPSIVPSGRT